MKHDESTPQRLCFGQCELRLDTRELWRAGVRQRVRQRVFDLLAFLVRHRPRVVPHGDLTQAVWRRADVPQTVLARAVMEARRACGDPSDAPRFVLSVRGVGYRFAGDVNSDALAAAPPPQGGVPTDTAVEEVRAMVRNARLAVFEHRFELARTLAQEALTRARALGVRSEQARALLVCASEALHRRRIAEAAGYAKQALQIAEMEAFAPLVAEARMALGGLHALAGDRDTGIRHLREAMKVFAQPGHEANLRACLNWLARAMRDHGELEASLQLCRRGVALKVPGQGAQPPILDRLNEMQLLLELGDRESEAGNSARAPGWYQEALQASRALLHDLEHQPHAIFKASCLSQQCVALERLDQLDEAQAAVRACDALRKQLAEEGRAWPDAENAAAFHMQRARLLARTEHIEQALALVHDALAAALHSEDEALADLYRLAADIALRAGRHEQAGAWLRARAEALVKAQRHRAASKAAILAAELDAEALHEQLEQARHGLREALAENAGLRRQLDHLDVPPDKR